MPEKPWGKPEHEDGKRGRGWINGIVLVALAVAVAAVTLLVLVPRERWENVWRSLPGRWEVLRGLLRGEKVEDGEPKPLTLPAPSLETPTAISPSDEPQFKGD